MENIKIEIRNKEKKTILKAIGVERIRSMKSIRKTLLLLPNANK